MRSTTSKAAYPGSALAKRNASLRAAAQLSALRLNDELYAFYVDIGRIKPERVTTLEGLAAMDEASGAQIDAGREPHLLREDIYDPGELITTAIYDTTVARVGKEGRVTADLHSGPAHLLRDTIVYWK